jgi:hypothetical protein
MEQSLYSDYRTLAAILSGVVPSIIPSSSINASDNKYFMDFEYLAYYNSRMGSRENRMMITPQAELDLHQLTADEALVKLDQFLSDAYSAGLTSVRIIHGKGTGVLRQVVREQAARHPLVKSFRIADPWEGGGGATILELVD